MENNIKGKVVVITGASSGIGEATAIVLAAKGAKVVLGARRNHRLEDLTQRIKTAGGEAVYRVTDIKQHGDLFQLVNLARETYGHLDVIVNNAGIARLSRMDEGQVADWEEMIDVNLKGTLYGMAAALPVFKKQGFGHVINIISTSGIKIAPLQGVYAGTKNAVRTISEALRQESGGQYRVTGISPGFVNTELTDYIQDEAVNTDAFSQDVLVSQIELLLNYSNRFYNRQFLTRKAQHNDLTHLMDTYLSNRFENPQNGIPSVQEVADQLRVSSRYLTDMLKSLTGQSTQQHIHDRLIEKAKLILSTTQLGIAEIAYQLGFEHPQSFNKLFKRTTNLSPGAFRKSFRHSFN